MTRARCIGAMAVGLLPWPLASVQGQLVDVDLTVQAGLFAPLTTRGHFEGMSAESEPRPGSLEVSQEAGPSVCGRATIWSPGVLGFEGSFSYASSALRTLRTFRENPSGVAEDSADGWVWFSTARVLTRFLREGPASFHVGGGAALVGRGSEGASTHTDWAGVVALGARVGRGSVALRFDAENVLYRSTVSVSDPAFGDVRTGARFQSDFAISGGLSLRLN